VIAFVVNAIRVALMALLVAGGDKLAFDYWHEGTGSNIFSLVTMMLFGLFCKFMIQSEPPEPPESAETP
jgi:exosortase/archaeosortase family protein